LRKEKYMTPETSPPQAVPPAAQVSMNQLFTEFVAGGETPLLNALKRALPQWIDDLTADYGNDLYERMQKDSDVDSNLETLVFSILSDGIRIEPAIRPKGPGEEPDAAHDANASQAQQYADFINRRFDEMAVPLQVLMKEMLGCLAEGNKVAEKVAVMVEDGIDAGKLTWRSITCRPRKNTVFVIDAHNQLVGLLTVQPTHAYVIQTGTILENPELLPNFLPRGKFFVMQHDCRNGDPRGRSILDSAYAYWFVKTQVLPEYYNYLRRFGTPSVVGKTPPGTDPMTPQVDAQGNQVRDGSGQLQMLTKEQALFNQLIKWINGTVLSVPGGTEIDVVQPEGHGEPFLNAFEWLGNQIAQAILKTARATQGSNTNSQADSGDAQDVMQLAVYYYKQIVGFAVTNDLIRPLMEMNFTDPAAWRELCPQAILTASEKADLPVLLTGFSQAGYTIHDSQFPGIDALLGLPPRDLQAIAQEKAQALDLQKQQIGAFNDVNNPAGGPQPIGNPTQHN
jgi:hypothetical protein